MTKKEFVKKGRFYQRLFLTKNGKVTEDLKKAVRIEEYKFKAIKQKDGSFKPGELLGVDFITIKRALK